MGERICRKGLHPIPEGKRKCPQCANARKRAKTAAQSKSSTLIECPICHQKFRRLTSRHTRIHGFPDIEVFKSRFGLDSCFTPEEKAKVSAYQAGRPKPHMSKDNHQKGLKRSAESRAKMSTSAVARCLRDKDSFFANVKGEWVFSEKADQAVYVRSSYEKRLLRVLDAHPDVVGLEMEPFSIPYEHEGVSRRYIPDFLVTFEGGIRELWEVKPSKFVGDPVNQAKIRGLNAYVSEHGINGCVVTLEAIEKMERAQMLRAATETGLTSALS